MNSIPSINKVRAIKDSTTRNHLIRLMHAVYSALHCMRNRFLSLSRSPSLSLSLSLYTSRHKKNRKKNSNTRSIRPPFNYRYRYNSIVLIAFPVNLTATEVGAGVYLVISSLDQSNGKQKIKLIDLV